MSTCSPPLSSRRPRNAVTSGGLPVAVGVALLAGAAACSPTADDGALCAPGTLHILSSTTAGEDPALSAVFNLFAERCPGVSLVSETPLNQVSQAEQFLDDMARGDPPDLFQFDAGRRSLHVATVEPGALYEPLDFLFVAEGWGDAYPAGTFEALATYDGHIYQLPYVSHRQNNLLFHTDTFATRGLTPPTTWDEFFVVADALRAEGIAPLTLALSEQDVWTAAILFESAFLATAGADTYAAFYAGERSPDDAAYVEALRLFARIASYATVDAATLSYFESLTRVAEGQAAMTVQGSWCNGTLATVGSQPGSTWQQTTAPGSQGIFLMAAGSMMMPLGARERHNAIAFLQLLGSQLGQQTYANVQITPGLRNDLQFDNPAIQTLADEQATARVVINQASSVPDAYLRVSDASIADFARAVTVPDADIDAAIARAVQQIAGAYPLLRLVTSSE
jgi:glucose/mannose transport system substrate-binding protein